jgi:hypothetical protein
MVSRTLQKAFAMRSLILLAIPTQEEARACWELCRPNDIGFWIAWLPLGSLTDLQSSADRTLIECSH